MEYFSSLKDDSEVEDIIKKKIKKHEISNIKNVLSPDESSSRSQSRSRKIRKQNKSIKINSFYDIVQNQNFLEAGIFQRKI